MGYYFETDTANLALPIFAVLFCLFLKEKRKKEILLKKHERAILLIFSSLISACLTLGKIGWSDCSIVDKLNTYSETIVKNEQFSAFNLSGFGKIEDKFILLVVFAGLLIITYNLIFFFLQKIKNYDVWLRLDGEKKKMVIFKRFMLLS